MVYIHSLSYGRRQPWQQFDGEIVNSGGLKFYGFVVE